MEGKGGVWEAEMRSKKFPDFSFERKLWKRGFNCILGMDEVGRGCFAGPVVAAGVVFPKQNSLPQLTFGKKVFFIMDSKKTPPARRGPVSYWIKRNALAWGIGVATVAEINRLGLAGATKTAFRRCVENAKRKSQKRIDYLLIDAFYIPYTRDYPINGKSPAKSLQMAIVKGDEKSLSIAGASIIAKVYRDSLMEKLGGKDEFRRYDWLTNKGYATKKHREAIISCGITKHHRKRFVDTYLKSL